MIIYNVTVNIDDSVHEDWLSWMKNKHIQDVMNSGYFSEYKFSKLITRQPDEIGQTYSIQYSCESLEKLEKYQSDIAPLLQKEHTERYMNKFVAFRTLMEVVD